MKSWKRLNCKENASLVYDVQVCLYSIIILDKYNYWIYKSRERKENI